MRTKAPHAGIRLIVRPKEVEASLWRRFRLEGEIGCRESLFNRYHKLARIIALHEFRRRPSYGLERNDFEQLAYGGLLEAIDRFDPLRGAPFEAYARHRIRGAISDGIAQSSENAAQYSCRRQTEIDRAQSIMSRTLDETSDYIAELTDVATLLAIGVVAESGKPTLEPMQSELGVYETPGWREMQLSIAQEIDRLPATEKSVMHQHYFNGVEFKHIAELLGVSKGRVSQLHRAALERVRARLRLSD